MNASNVLGCQGMREQNAGYRAGLRGDPKPGRDKGRAYYNGWVNGRADRERAQQERNYAVV